MQTPYFVFKPEILEKNYNELKKHCDKYFEKYIIAYSVKTNSYIELLKKLEKLGSGFEIASLNELALIKNTSKLNIFNGPAKTEEELANALKNKFLINVDSLSEIDKIIKILEGKKLEIGLRISLKESKFGFDESKLKEVFEKCNSNSLDVISFHFHCGTQLSLKEYENNLIKVANFLEKFLKSYEKDIKLKYINLGGGFPDKLKLSNSNIELEDYIKLVAEYLSKIKKKYDCSIIIEPGRVLVADAFDLITKVITIKKNFDETYAILDAGINLLPKITLSNYKFSKVDQFKEFKTNSDELNSEEKKLLKESKEYILAGPLLFNNDILGRFHCNLKENNLIKVENVGAYCYNLAWEISYKKPRIVVKK